MLGTIESTSNISTNFKSYREFPKKSFGVKKGANSLVQLHKSILLVTSGELLCYFCQQSYNIYRCPSFAKL